MTEEQKLALAKLLNLLMALCVDAQLSSRSHQDIWSAAEAFGISKLDLLRATSDGYTLPEFEDYPEGE